MAAASRTSALSPHLREAAGRQREADLTKACLDYLAAVPGVFAFRANSGAMFGQHKGNGWAVRFGFPGCADILGWVDGCRWEPPGQIHVGGWPCDPKGPFHVARFLALETKLPGWKPRNRRDRRRWELQQAFLHRVLDAGGIGACVESVEDVMRVLGR